MTIKDPAREKMRKSNTQHLPVCPFCRGRAYQEVSNYSRTHFYVLCASKRCEAQGPVRKSRVSALRAWRHGRYWPDHGLGTLGGGN